MIENFKCALDRGEYIAYISMDISNAFASYLYKRKQRVKIGNLKSDRK